MNGFRSVRAQLALILLCILSLTSCGPVKPTITNKYTLNLIPSKVHRAKVPDALLISKPEAMAGYRTEQMLYVNKQFSLAPFAKNAWSNPPADMLYPLLVERFQESHAFRAISSSPYADKADYRLDTQLLTLNQNFLKKPSQLHFTAKITLTRIKDNHVLGSRLMNYHIPCRSNTPYGGVVAANQAATRFTTEALDFVLSAVRKDH